ncbi:lung adenoma susceptibility protein 2 [Pelodytes ibericus]
MARSSSPDSTISISSLLASCSLGSTSSSSTRPADLACSVVYKDRLYDSASKALEAYIEDFDESFQSPGEIMMYTSARRTPVTKRASSMVKGRHAPSRRRPVPSDPDLLSLTTDDLLCYPSDGSLPLSLSSLSEHKHGRTRRNQHVHSFKKQIPPSSSVNRRPKLNILDLQKPQHFPEGLAKECRKARYIPYGTDSENKPVFSNRMTSSYLSKEPTLPKDYPRWLTSQKIELSVSGLSSVPDLNYPVWLKNNDLLSDSDNDAIYNSYRSIETCPHSRATKKQSGAVALGRSNSLHVPLSSMYPTVRRKGHDHDGFPKVTPANEYPASYLHDMDINKHGNTLLTTHGKGDPNNPFVKTFSSPLKNNGSPRTEDVLEAERSWEKIPFPLKSPVPVLCEDGDHELENPSQPNLVEEFLNDCLLKDKVPASTFSGGHHHGPVEALKHMLFNLQTFQQSFSQTKAPEQTKDVKNVNEDPNSESSHLDQEMFPVNKSLQKAMHHLSRLKELVGENKEKNQEH